MCNYNKFIYSLMGTIFFVLWHKREADSIFKFYLLKEKERYRFHIQCKSTFLLQWILEIYKLTGRLRQNWISN